MTVVTFSAGDKDYIDKLNLLAVQSADALTIKDEAKNSVLETKQALETVKDKLKEAKSLQDRAFEATLSQLTWLVTSTSHELVHADAIALNSINAVSFTIQTDLSIGSYFTIKNFNQGDGRLSLGAYKLTDSKERVAKPNEVIVIPKNKTLRVVVVAPNELRFI